MNGLNFLSRIANAELAVKCLRLIFKVLTKLRFNCFAYLTIGSSNEDFWYGVGVDILDVPTIPVETMFDVFI